MKNRSTNEKISIYLAIFFVLVLVVILVLYFLGIIGHGVASVDVVLNKEKVVSYSKSKWKQVSKEKYSDYDWKKFTVYEEGKKKGTYSLPLTLSKEVVDFINSMLQQDPSQRLTANQLLSHDFLTKHPSQFQRIDVKNIQGSIGPGGVINMKSNPNSQPKFNPTYNLFNLWSIFNQPGNYSGIPQQISNQVQPVMQLPQQYGFVAQPQQQQYYISQPAMGAYY